MATPEHVTSLTSPPCIVYHGLDLLLNLSHQQLTLNQST